MACVFDFFVGNSASNVAWACPRFHAEVVKGRLLALENDLPREGGRFPLREMQRGNPDVQEGAHLFLAHSSPPPTVALSGHAVHPRKTPPRSFTVAFQIPFTSGPRRM